MNLKNTFYTLLISSVFFSSCSDEPTKTSLSAFYDQKIKQELEILSKETKDDLILEEVELALNGFKNAISLWMGKLKHTLDKIR